MKIQRIDIIEKDARAFATFEDGQKLPMHYTSAERVFNMLVKLHSTYHEIKNNRETVQIMGNEIKVFKTYKELVNI